MQCIQVLSTIVQRTAHDNPQLQMAMDDQIATYINDAGLPQTGSLAWLLLPFSGMRRAVLRVIAGLLPALNPKCAASEALVSNVQVHVSAS